MRSAMRDTMPICRAIAIAIVPVRMTTKGGSVRTMLVIVIVAILAPPITRLMVGRRF
ncbi:hypothetical protein SAMN05192541_109122 [Bradyrhizobium arachidis]|nr:hypothetical protein SAMN05192541_109122 [Bradyrhizobium arachidis]